MSNEQQSQWEAEGHHFVAGNGHEGAALRFPFSFQGQREAEGQARFARKGQYPRALRLSLELSASGHNDCVYKGKVALPPAEIPNVGGAGQSQYARKGHHELARVSNLNSDLHLIRELYGQRRELLGVQTGMTNRLKAIVKAKAGLAPDAMVSEELIRTTDYPPLATLLQARGTVAKHIGSLDDAMTKCVVNVPAYALGRESVD